MPSIRGWFWEIADRARSRVWWASWLGMRAGRFAMSPDDGLVATEEVLDTRGWPDDLVGTVRQLARANAREFAAPPFTEESPILEVLVAEVASRLPPPLARRLTDCTRAEELFDWIGAGVLYRFAEPFGRAATQPLLAELGTLGPRHAAPLFARGVVNSLGLLRPTGWDAIHDALGASLSVVVLAGFALARVWLLTTLAAGDAWPAPWGFGGLPTWNLLATLPAALGSVALAPGVDARAFFAPALGWLGLETLLATRVAEWARLRQLARSSLLATPRATRCESLYLVATSFSFAAWLNVLASALGSRQVLVSEPDLPAMLLVIAILASAPMVLGGWRWLVRGGP